jgi:hypothetical protein
VLGLAVLAFAPGTAAAAPVEHVTTSADSGPGSLRAAVAAVDPGGTVIIDAPHDPALTSQVVIDRTLTLVGQGAGETVITGSANDRVLDLDSVPEATVTIRALTITGGNAPVDPNGEGGDGGGIRAGTSISLILDSVLLAGNHAGDGAAGQSSPSEDGGDGGNGGGLYTDGPQTTIQDSWFLNNTAGRGGDGGNGSAGEDGEVGGNGGHGGGAASLPPAGPLNFIDSTLSGNSAGIGGDGGQGSGLPSGSSAPGGRGGSGGGVFGNTLGSLVLVNSTVEGNTAGNGGAGGTGLIPAGGGEGGDGGGAFAGDTVVDSSTIARNSTGAGGAGIVEGDPGRSGGVESLTAGLIAARTIIASNSADLFPNCSGVQTNGGDNLVFPADPQCMPGASINADPLLGPLASNGGPTPTLALGSGSPAIDRYSAFCPAADQRGVSRPQGAACDIGAFERVPDVIPPTTTPAAPPPTTPPASAPAKKCKKGFVLKKVKTKKGTKKKCVKKKKKKKK